MISRASLLRLADNVGLSGLQLPRSRRAPAAPILKPYDDSKNLRFRLIAAALLLGLVGFCLIYGFFFAVTAPYLATQSLIPIVVVMGLAVWALPEQRTAPVGALSVMFTAYIIGLLLWPRYLALALPGLPWISMQRLTGFPLALLLMICISSSADFRKELSTRLKGVPYIWPLFLLFIAAQIISLPFSKEIVASVQRVVSQQIDWTCIFLVSCYICARKGRSWKILWIIMATAAINVVFAVWEAKDQALPWINIVPSFLKVQDAEQYLQGWKRTIDGVYRAKSVFSTPLGLAEYLALLTPFFLHMVVTNYPLWKRLIGLVMLPAAALAIELSHSRVGTVGMFVSTVFYVLFWGLVRWRNSKSDVIGPAIVLGYPVLAGIAYMTAMTIPAVRIRLLGGGSQQSSTQARFNQFDMAFPKFLANPIGHGAGQAGGTMGYAPGQFVTVDSYYIITMLEYGALGLFAIIGIFVSAIVASLNTAFREKIDPTSEEGLILPITVGLAAFLVIKLVFGQPDNHPMVFVLVGMLVALLSRRREAKAAAATGAAA